MIDLNKITRDFVRTCVLNEEFDIPSDEDLILENGDFIRGSLGAQIQNIFEVIDGVRLTSNRDRNRMSLAKENMKKVRRHVRMLESKVEILQEQVTLLEESATKAESREK